MLIDRHYSTKDGAYLVPVRKQYGQFELIYSVLFTPNIHILPVLVTSVLEEVEGTIMRYLKHIVIWQLKAGQAKIRLVAGHCN